MRKYLYETNPEFVGVSELTKKQSEQLAMFEEWAAKGDWIKFHQNHYDWWMFPIDKPSKFGLKYTVYSYEVSILKKDSAFIKNYLRGAELLMLSWGWNLYDEKLITNPGKNQSWANWPIRLNKCGASLKLFGFTKEFNSVRNYAMSIIKKSNDFMCKGIDCSVLFKLKILVIRNPVSPENDVLIDILKMHFPQAIVHTYDIPLLDHMNLANDLMHLIDEFKIDLVVATELAGWFAQKLYGVKKLLLRPLLNLNFLNEYLRENLINPKLFKYYKALEKRQFKINGEEKKNTIAIFSKNQEESKKLFENYYDQTYFFTSDETINHTTMKNDVFVHMKKLIPEYFWEI